MKEQIENALGVIIPQMVRWAERMIGLLFDKDAVDKPSISFSKNGDAAFVHVTSCGDSGPVLQFFLRSLSFRFTVQTMPNDTPGGLAIYGIGIQFEHKSGGSNGWTTEAQFLYTERRDEAADKTLVFFEQTRPCFREK